MWANACRPSANSQSLRDKLKTATGRVCVVLIEEQHFKMVIVGEKDLEVGVRLVEDEGVNVSVAISWAY
jgi:hypothetical protein